MTKTKQYSTFQITKDRQKCIPQTQLEESTGAIITEKNELEAKSIKWSVSLYNNKGHNIHDIQIIFKEAC